MDLNHLYSQHQIALMKADGAASALDRHRYLDCALLIAGRIGTYQRSKGAEAGRSWLGDRTLVAAGGVPL
jgi:hypothetical protein